MMKILELAAHTTAFIVLTVLTVRLCRNLQFLRRVSLLRPAKVAFPRVSVLVPARNEARTIMACIESLAQQDYPNFEVIVLDDQSTDETGVLLDELAAKYVNVRAVHSREAPPTGWNGKSYACQRLADAASGEWLLLTDADTVHTPTSIRQGITQAQALGVRLLSAMPHQITESWSERIAVSFILDFLPLIALDLPGLVENTSTSVAANGQYLLAHALTYRALGGHRAIFNALVDDFALARHFRANGYPIALVGGVRMLSCRMYRTRSEVWQGFSKNILLGLETSSAEKRPIVWALGFAWSYFCLFILPVYHLFLPEQRFLALLAVAWLAVLRALVNQQLKRPVGEILTTLLAAWSVMVLGLNALIRRARGAQMNWKGRTYSTMH